MAKIDKTYQDLLETILDNGFKYEDPNRKGVYRYQIPSYQFIHDFKDGFPAITTKKLYWKGIVSELLWFLRGDTNIKYLVDNGVNIWNKDAYNYYLQQCKNYNVKPVNNKNFLYHIKNKTGRSVWGNNNYKLGDLGRVYGTQWKKWSGYKRDGFSIKSYTDQISTLIKGLKENPMGTRHIVTAWNPAELDDMALPPCHWSFEILVEPLSVFKQILFKKDNSEKGWTVNEERSKYQFTLKWHQRSVDSFLGLPFNMASYALLAHIIGKMTNMVPKGIIGDLSNVHIYEPHLDAVKEQLSRDVNKHNKCELEPVVNRSYNELDNINDWLKVTEIGKIKLKDYRSYPAIPAEMLNYNK